MVGCMSMSNAAPVIVNRYLTAGSLTASRNGAPAAAARRQT